MVRRQAPFLAVIVTAALALGADAQGPPPLAEFGLSVAATPDTIIVAARHGIEGSPGEGAIHLFERRSQGWTEVAVLPAPDARVEDLFGIPMAADAETLVVGAQFADVKAKDAGLAYVFERREGRWRRSAVLVANDGAMDDQFGLTVSVSGRTIVVGARLRDGVATDAGGAYVFERRDAAWEQVATLTASDAAQGDLFGRAGLDGNTLIVSADLNDDRGQAAGKAYVFERRSGTWTEAAILHASDAAEGDELGVTLAVRDRTAVLGAIGRDDAGQDSGAAYVFEQRDGRWVESARLAPSDAAPRQAFGLSVAIDTNVLVVGAPYDAAGGEGSGAAYVFERVTGAWIQTAKLSPSDGGPRRGFGSAVAVSSGTVVVGVRRSATGQPGAAYVFERVERRWAEVARLVRARR